MEESGLHLEHPAAATFRAHVLAGDWSKADHDLRALHDLLRDTEPRALAMMKFAVLEQKYLEHLEVSSRANRPTGSADGRFTSAFSVASGVMSGSLRRRDARWTRCTCSATS